MKTEPRISNVYGILLLALFALALLAACFGGNIDVAVDGVNLPPGSLPPFTNSEPVVAQGTIDGEFDTGGRVRAARITFGELANHNVTLTWPDEIRP